MGQIFLSILFIAISFSAVLSAFANSGDIMEELQTTNPKRILIPVPLDGFDPTEAAVPFKILKEAGHKIIFATPNARVAQADQIMITGKGLKFLKWNMRADYNGRRAYREMEKSPEFLSPISYKDIVPENFDMILLPGGHAKEMRPYLESKILQDAVSIFMEDNKIVAAICHGVVLAARSVNPQTNKSVLYGRKVTTLPNWMELMAHKLTKLWMGNYYRTYPSTTTQNEVMEALAKPQDFISGPKSLKRDRINRLNRGHIVVDGNLITARWPGDAHRFGVEIAKMLK